MKSNNYADLKDLENVLYVTADSFIEAITMVQELPPKKIEDGIASCSRCLEILKREFDKFKRDILGGHRA